MHDASHEQQEEQRQQDEVKGWIEPGMVLASLRLLLGQDGSPVYGLDVGSTRSEFYNE
jgi:hypothetical protein